MSFFQNGFSSLGSFLGIGATATSANILPTFAGLNPRPFSSEAASPVYASPVYATPIYGAAPAYQAAGYANQIQAAPAAPTCSIDYFSYTTIVPLVEVTRTHDITKTVNTTIYIPMVTTTVIVDVETIIAKKGGTPSIVIAQTTNCADGYPTWQTAVQPNQYQPVYQQVAPAGDDRTAAYRNNQGNMNYQPYYDAPQAASSKKKSRASATPTRIWAQATPEYQPYPTNMNAW